MQCNPELAIFTTAAWISEIPKEVQKKLSTREFLAGTFEKLKSAIGPASAVTGSVGSNSLSPKCDKKEKSKHKEATALFYDTTPNSTTRNIEEMDFKTETSNVASPAGSEEFKSENCDKSLERRSTNTVQTQTQPYASILKHTHNDQVRPSQMMSMGNRDIVVIDNKDIDESTRNEVIVFDKPKDIDLVELLSGTNWPKMAGDTAAIINNKQNASTTRQPSAGVGGAGIEITHTGTQKRNRNKSSSNTKKSSDSIGGQKKNIDKKHQNNQKNAARNSSYPSQTCYENYDKCKSQPLYANTSNDDMIDTDAYDTPNGLLPAVLDGSFTEYSPLEELDDTGLSVGSMVEVNVPEVETHLYGVIRWIGVPPNANKKMVGVELEEDCIDKQLLTTDGGFDGISLFKCPSGRGLFVTPDQCSSDRRFIDEEGAVAKDVSSVNNNYKSKQLNGSNEEHQTFGHMDCPIVPGAIAPIKCYSLKDLEDLCGKFKGIQGHHNSCYLDVTLFSMFAFTPVFDAVLYRPPDKEDISHYLEVQTVLREEIVNPLRKNMFVRADRVMKLRQLLDKLSSVSGLTSEEKDPEEFLNCILAQILRAEPFLKLNSGQDAYYYQLFVEKDDRLSFPSVQQLFEQSFYTSDIKLKEVPSCLIIQMPRFGKNYKMYPRILPSQVLDVTDIIEDSPRQCSVCGKLAEFECRDCFGVLQSGVGLESTSFCPKCLETVHMHVKRSNHKYRELSVPQDFKVMANHMTVPRLYMELFAVVCIETSHYVTFVKAGSGPDAPWCFFDSMADRKGEQNGYNIPEMITVPDLPQWLSEEGSRVVNETSSNDKMLPEHAKRLFCDAYMCMYQSTDVMMYR
ncbi:ubiquitin carboxyl-terminal hydrolase CYLD isoform X3 [Haematobia irritans]